jgi:RNA polymerase sigma-70 factor, ECF subfamily
MAPIDSLPSNRVGRGAEDRRLMLAVAAGDVAALESLYDRYRSVVFGLCVRVLGRGPDAEEVLEDVFYELWRRADRYDPRRASPLAYLLLLARSRALDRVRTLRRRGVLEEQLATELTTSTPTPAGAASPLGDAVIRERREAAREALAQLEPAERHVVELSFFHGLSHGEIAERLHEPVGTVKTRIRRGLGRLRSALASHRSAQELS